MRIRTKSVRSAGKRFFFGLGSGQGQEQSDVMEAVVFLVVLKAKRLPNKGGSAGLDFHSWGADGKIYMKDMELRRQEVGSDERKRHFLYEKKKENEQEFRNIYVLLQH